MPKKKRPKVCLTCGYKYEDKWYMEHPPLREYIKVDVKLTKEYCKDQMRIYTHKNCKPIWCDECQNLEEYLVNY